MSIRNERVPLQRIGIGDGLASRIQDMTGTPPRASNLTKPISVPECVRLLPQDLGMADQLVALLVLACRLRVLPGR